MKAALLYILWGVGVAQGCGSEDFAARERASRRLERAGGLGLLVGAAGSLLSHDPEVRWRMSRAFGGLEGELADWVRGALLLGQAPHPYYGLHVWMTQDNAAPGVYLKALWLGSLLGCEPAYRWAGMRGGEANSAYWLNYRLDDARVVLWGYRPQDR